MEPSRIIEPSDFGKDEDIKVTSRLTITVIQVQKFAINALIVNCHEHCTKYVWPVREVSPNGNLIAKRPQFYVYVPKAVMLFVWYILDSLARWWSAPFEEKHFILLLRLVNILWLYTESGILKVPLFTD